MDGDYTGKDYSVNLKLINPDITTLSGIINVTYLQSMTSAIAMGTNFHCRRDPVMMDESDLGIILRKTGDNYIAGTEIKTSGSVQMNYYHKIGDRVHAALELEVVPSALAQAQQVAASRVGAGLRYEFHHALLRAQLESTGQISAFLEERISPHLSFLFSGMIDHSKNFGHFGFGLQFQ
jgi:mitochondrial import receptor subunit TOM40